MKILGVITARGGSKGVKEKNIKLLSGKPLIAYTIECALKSNLCDVIVSTDNYKIKEISEELGANVPFIRPPDLSSDSASSLDVIVHALKSMEEINSTKYDAVMLLQPTSPFRTSNDINHCIDLLNKRDDADSVISVVDVGSHHPARMKYISDDFLIDPPFCEKKENQNRQELEPMYIRNGVIYLTRSSIIKKRSFKGKNCLAYLMPMSRSLNIDTQFDFDLCDWVINKTK
jgi:CMP-N,N'-diacetyllegionaminic acid synthase